MGRGFAGRRATMFLSPSPSARSTREGCGLDRPSVRWAQRRHRRRCALGHLPRGPGVRRSTHASEQPPVTHRADPVAQRIPARRAAFTPLAPRAQPLAHRALRLPPDPEQHEGGRDRRRKVQPPSHHVLGRHRYRRAAAAIRTTESSDHYPLHRRLLSEAQGSAHLAISRPVPMHAQLSARGSARLPAARARRRPHLCDGLDAGAPTRDLCTASCFLHDTGTELGRVSSTPSSPFPLLHRSLPHRARLRSPQGSLRRGRSSTAIIDRDLPPNSVMVRPATTINQSAREDRELDHQLRALTL